jgi:hypothetical protein
VSVLRRTACDSKVLRAAAIGAFCARTHFFWCFLQSAMARPLPAMTNFRFTEWTYGRPYVFHGIRLRVDVGVAARRHSAACARIVLSARAANLLTVKKDRNSFRAVETRA